jgi:hypothetical protein
MRGAHSATQEVAVTVDGRIELVLTGSRTSEGAVEFDALLSFGDAFRKALRALVRSRSGLPAVQPGQPGADIREASSLRLTGLRAGSTVLELESLDPRIVADPAIDALQALVDGLAGEQALEAPVIDLLRDAVQSLGERSSVGMSVPGRPPVEFDESRLGSLVGRAAPAGTAETRGSVDGWLHAVDIDPDEVRIRDAAGRDWSCHYPQNLEMHVRGLIGRVVRASGTIRTAGTRSRIELAGIQPVELPAGVVGGGRRSADEVLAEAMADSSLSAPQSLASLASDVDATAEEEAAFEEALRAIR